MKPLQQNSIILLLTVFGILSLSCRDNDDPVDFKEKRSRYNENTPITLHNEESYPDLLNNLMAAESRCIHYPESIKVIENLITLSYNEKNQSIYVAGTAFAGAEQENYELYLITQRQAARKAAYKWALFIKTYLSQKQVIDRTKIRGKIMYSKVLVEEAGNDSLYQLFAIPLTSIVLQ